MMTDLTRNLWIVNIRLNPLRKINNMYKFPDLKHIKQYKNQYSTTSNILKTERNQNNS
jgi:heme oxygenase